MRPENKKQFEQEAARQCAPVMAGLKPANLLILDQAHQKLPASFFEETGLSGKLLYQSERKAIWMVYRPDELEGVLKKPEIRCFLKACRYEDSDSLQELLNRLARRFAIHRRQGDGFPHEMGLFLGYPLGDVEGFIQNNGKNYLFCGYWKVYENPEETRKTFALFQKAQQTLLEALRGGMNLRQAVSQPLQTAAVSG